MAIVKFTEAKLEEAIIQMLRDQGYPYTRGPDLGREPNDVLIRSDLREFLKKRYTTENITDGEIDSIIRQLDALNAADLYDSNKTVCKWVSDGFLLKREDRNQKDLYVQLIDYGLSPFAPRKSAPDVLSRSERRLSSDATLAAEDQAGYELASDPNIYRIVNQLEIEGREKRIPDLILYINGLPLVVFEFKSAIRENATLHNAFEQLTVRYARDIPELMKYNALCVISDGVNNKMGSLFAEYEFFYTWQKITGDESATREGINSLHTMLQGLFDQHRLRQVIRDFVYFPDVSKAEDKIVCRYPQFYAALKLYQNILAHRKPEGDGKGGTYFGATGCGKSFTMLFLTRLLMKSLAFESPTILLITDRTDLDDQLSKQFTNAKGYIGDQTVESVESRQQLRDLLAGRQSGGVFLTTIHKFTEDAQLLTDRTNVICISDEAHRSQVNLDQKVSFNKDRTEVRKTYGFAKYLHDSLPNATYVGFTGTPIDATLDVFGEVVDAYTMTESVKDEITVRIVYEGRAAKVLLDNSKLAEIEAYYQRCADEGASDYQIEESKKASAQMNAILGDPDRIKAVAADFVAHYERRVSEGSTVEGKAMFVCSKREIAWSFFKEVIALRPEWNEVRRWAGDQVSRFGASHGSEHDETGASAQTDQSNVADVPTEQELKKIKPMERIKMIMTRGKDDQKELYDLLGGKDYRKELDRQFKNLKSNFKIAIVVDMWLTGFDVPSLDSIYIDKPLKKHNLIQTISRVNRKFESKQKGLVIDYIGIKTAMNKALAQYNKVDEQNFEDIAASIVVVKDHLDLLRKIFHHFDSSSYFGGDSVSQLDCLNKASEYVQTTQKIEKRFMGLVKRMKAAYDICCGSEGLTEKERDEIHFYLAVRSIVFKLTKGNAPDSAQMNKKVREMIAEALKSDGVEELFKLGEREGEAIDIFDDDYLKKLEKIKLPNTRVKLLQQLLAKAIADFGKTNRAKGIDFTNKFEAIVKKYNERKEDSLFSGEAFDDITNDLVELVQALGVEQGSFAELGIDFEEKAFYDILKALAAKYDFTYPEDKLINLAKAVKAIVDDKAKYPDWSQRDDIKAELKVALVLVLAEHGYPPVDKDEVYKEIYAQAENFKKHRSQ